MKKEKWKTFVTDRWKVAAPGLLAAFAVCFIFFIYAPLELYVTNQTEFWFDFYKILKAVLQNFALFFGLNVLGILLAACISKVFCRFVTAAELVVLLTLYVQGNFLVNHMPPFDGTEIVWEDYRGENIKTAIVCILIAAAVVTMAKLLGAKRFQGICMAVSAGLSGILMITLVTMTVTTGAYRERTTYYALENGQYRLSQDQNFLVLLLDAVDAKTFEEVMDSDPAYTETFADFTYYPDMVGAYPWTAFSVPYILSGKWYEGEEYYLDYAAAAVDESGLFRELSERDYDIALYESDPWVTSYTETLEANIRVIGQFLDKLKQSDLYDNSVIIVMADHGFDPQNEVSAYDRQNPLFLVKGVGESHPLQTSLVPAAYEDLQDAYVRLMDGAAGDAIFPYQEGEKRERRYIFYENTEHVMYEWLQTGPAWDFNAYRETGNKYPRKN